jgi:hypothetical protein
MQTQVQIDEIPRDPISALRLLVRPTLCGLSPVLAELTVTVHLGKALGPMVVKI